MLELIIVFLIFELIHIADYQMSVEIGKIKSE